MERSSKFIYALTFVLFFAFILFFPGYLCGNSDIGVVGTNGEEIEIVRKRNFKGSALYGFMNGGSDLYYEYGFVDLEALDVRYQGNEFSVEIYKMDSPENAFGIYSIHAFDFVFRDTLFTYCNFSDYQFQTVIGDRYYSVVYNAPHKGVNEKVLAVVKALSQGDKSREVEIPELAIANSNGVTGEIKMMAGHLSVMNGMSDLSNYITGLKQFRVWCFPGKERDRVMALLLSENEDDLKIVTSRIPRAQMVSKDKSKILFYIY